MGTHQANNWRSGTLEMTDKLRSINLFGVLWPIAIFGPVMLICCLVQPIRAQQERQKWPSSAAGSPSADKASAISNFLSYLWLKDATLKQELAVFCSHSSPQVGLMPPFWSGERMCWLGVLHSLHCVRMHIKQRRREERRSLFRCYLLTLARSVPAFIHTQGKCAHPCPP